MPLVSQVWRKRCNWCAMRRTRCCERSIRWKLSLTVAFLVEEYVDGPSLLDVLRARSVLSAPEVVRLLSLLAPLADHASSHRLQHVDLTLLGIHLTYRAPTGSGIQPDLLHAPPHRLGTSGGEGRRNRLFVLALRHRYLGGFGDPDTGRRCTAVRAAVACAR